MFGDELSGEWEGAGFYELSGDDLDAMAAGMYDVGDAQADQIAELLQAASAGYSPDVNRLLAASAGLTARTQRLGSLAARGAASPGHAAAAAKLLAANRQIAALRTQLAAQGRQPCLPGINNFRPVQFPMAAQYAAASPVRGGFGSVPGMIPTRTEQPQEVRGSALGFDSVSTIAAGATVNIVTRPQGPFRPERLVIPPGAPGIATDVFLINDVKIGNTSQLPAATSLPQALFAPNAVGISQRWDTAQYGGDVLINVTNTDAAPRRFVAAMVGTFLRP